MRSKAYNSNVLYFPHSMYSVISTDHNNENVPLMVKQPECMKPRINDN